MENTYFNLSFDDVHPESSSDGMDCGGDRDSGVFKYLIKLWEKYPKLKITLFVTPNWIDRANDPFPVKQFKRLAGLKYTKTWQDEPFLLTKHKVWCKWLNSFPNCEIAIHGYNHHTDARFHSQEFQNMPYDECKKRLERAECIFRESGLHYVRGFRPPGWGISDELFQALRELNYDFISIDSIPCRINNLSRYKVEKYRGLVNVPQNWDIARGTNGEGVDIARKYGLLMAKGHISNSYDGEYIGNGLNGRTFERLCDLLDNVGRMKKVQFASMKDILNAKEVS